MNKELPAEWLEVLRKIQAVFPGAKIAGGALRDLENGREIKDVDIFCPISTNPGMDELVWSLFDGEDIVLNPIVSYTTVHGDNDGDDRALHAVFTLNKGGWQYDIILATPEDCDIENFDINICQVQHDGNVMKSTPAYKYGVRSKTIKVVHVNRKDRNAKRIDRLCAKYPDFELAEEEVYDLFN